MNDINQEMSEALQDIELKTLVKIWLRPQSSLDAIWERIKGLDATGLQELREQRLLDRVLLKTDHYSWCEMKSLWPLLEPTEVILVLSRASRARVVGWWDEGDIEQITGLLLTHSECKANHLFTAMQVAPSLRKALFSELVAKAENLYQIIACLGFKEVCREALNQILSDKIETEFHTFANQRQHFAQFEARYLNATELADLLVWQVEQGVLSRESLKKLAEAKGYKRAVKQALNRVK